ncbi:hypothetical protein SVAN01_03142 [Stagonosporopsis vannaccii]|nr:hypothetical protein SVAN01_03142 [Stagonosporopsis vannaccii]
MLGAQLGRLQHLGPGQPGLARLARCQLLCRRRVPRELAQRDALAQRAGRARRRGVAAAARRRVGAPPQEAWQVEASRRRCDAAHAREQPLAEGMQLRRGLRGRRGSRGVSVVRPTPAVERRRRAGVAAVGSRSVQRRTPALWNVGRRQQQHNQDLPDAWETKERVQARSAPAQKRSECTGVLSLRAARRGRPAHVHVSQSALGRCGHQTALPNEPGHAAAAPAPVYNLLHLRLRTRKLCNSAARDSEYQACFLLLLLPAGSWLLLLLPGSCLLAPGSCLLPPGSSLLLLLPASALCLLLHRAAADVSLAGLHYSSWANPATTPDSSCFAHVPWACEPLDFDSQYSHGIAGCCRPSCPSAAMPEVEPALARRPRRLTTTTPLDNDHANYMVSVRAVGYVSRLFRPLSDCKHVVSIAFVYGFRRLP